MAGFFSRLKSKDGSGKPKSKKGAGLDQHADRQPAKPKWDDAYARETVEPEEIQDLIRRATEELKARALDLPFLLLPFRPTSDPSAVRTFVRHFFNNGQQVIRGEALARDLRMIEPMVIAGVVKWCWSRLEGGIVGWDSYDLFRVGEHDSNMARDAFKTFIPLSVENGARSCIIFDFFDLMAAIAAHGKTNGFGGRKLSRLAAWWAFEHKDTGDGFEGGYKAWAKAADATSHLFFAYLRSICPEQPLTGITMLPMSLQKLLQETEYPPQRPMLMQTSTSKVVMIVDSVSPTPFALLRRANHFQYRDQDKALQMFSDFEDPATALTEECHRVLRAISSVNESAISSAKHSTGLRDAAWSRFEDVGFGGALEEDDDRFESRVPPPRPQGLRTTPASATMDLGRPTTPSWADFLSSGFVDDSQNGATNHLLPPDKVLPPIETTTRQKSSQSHKVTLDSEHSLEPGELASIARFDLDDAFWWVWISSLSGEETVPRKAAFGRCAIIETIIRSGRWLVLEEQVKGAAPEPQEGAYIAEKKSLFSWTRRGKGVSRRKSTGKDALSRGNKNVDPAASKSSVIPDQQARIAAAAAQLQARQQRELQQQAQLQRRGRNDPDFARDKTNSVFTLQPVIMKEASPAMKWARKYDTDATREANLMSQDAGRGPETSPRHPNGNNGYASFHDRANEPEQPPRVPSKEPSLLSQPSPALSSSNPLDVPPAEGNGYNHRAEKVEPSHDMVASNTVDDELSGRDSPLPPPKDSYDQPRENMLTPPPQQFGANHHKKLQKDKAGGGGGLKKFFARKNRGSKLPENASTDLNAMLQREPQREPQQDPQFEEARRFAPTPPPAPEVRQEEKPEPPLPSPTPAETFSTPMEEPATPPVQSTNNEARSRHDDELSRVDTRDAQEAQEEFSRFDQGPLSDQPAFIPDSDSDDDATPPPIARRYREVSDSPSPQSESTGREPIVLAGNGPRNNTAAIQDRWAQIRKNAAERTAQRRSEDQSRGAYSKTTTDDGDDTSGEETIESRVARIKARVAELTGNMEGTTAPPPPRPSYR